MSNPISRNEKLLDVITGHSGIENLKEPMSRNEKLLAKYIGVYSGSVEEPKSRIETYLHEMITDKEEMISELDIINGEVI